VIDRYLVRDAQRVIEAIEALVRIHTAKKISTTPSWHSDNAVKPHNPTCAA
jgi:hypothetical protein